jgi:hypothetical protein
MCDMLYTNMRGDSNVSGNKTTIAPRPVISTRVSWKALATLVLWTEELQYQMEKEVGIPTTPYHVHSFSELIREVIESVARNIAQSKPQMAIEDYDNAIKVLESRGLRIPQGKNTRNSLLQALRDEHMRAEGIDFEERITKQKMLERESEEEEVKAETPRLDKEEYQRKLEEFEERERIKLEALRNAQDSIIRGEE